MRNLLPSLKKSAVKMNEFKKDKIWDKSSVRDENPKSELNRIQNFVLYHFLFNTKSNTFQITIFFSKPWKGKVSKLIPISIPNFTKPCFNQKKQTNFINTKSDNLLYHFFGYRIWYFFLYIKLFRFNPKLKRQTLDKSQ